jgi:hypothetical protein
VPAARRLLRLAAVYPKFIRLKEHWSWLTLESPKTRAATNAARPRSLCFFALSIFSVLSLTFLRNPTLEAVLRTSDSPDLHVVLYTGGAGSPQVIGRLNMPTVGREESSSDISTEIRAPGLVGGDLRGELPPGSIYAVQVTPNLRICCDNGDNACGGIAWDQPLNEAKVSPAVGRPLETTTTKRDLQFSLSSAEIADNVVLDPDALTKAPFLIKAAKVQNGDVATPLMARQSPAGWTRERRLLRRERCNYSQGPIETQTSIAFRPVPSS